MSAPPVTASPLGATSDSQSRSRTATVITAAPIFIAPDAPQPLRVAAIGTTLNVLREDGDWLQVEFSDPQWGRRTGWVHKTNVKVSNPDLQPMDLSIRDTPASDPAVLREGVQAPRSGQPIQDPATTTSRPPQIIREGFWFNAGMGFGSLGCEDCVGRETGLSGGLSLGGRINDKWLLGVGTTGWSKNLGGENLTVGTLDARFRFYPVRTSGFFLTGGIGAGSISVAGDSEFGVGAVIGAGWDIRVSRNVSLTPFYNGFAMSSSTVDANVGQLGLGVTIH
jgi:hypothetical protein